MKITKGNIIFKGLFMLINNIVIDGLGGLSLFIHKIFWEIRNFILQTKTYAFYNSIDLFFGNAYRCSNLTFIWSQLIPTIWEPKFLLMLVRILWSL